MVDRCNQHELSSINATSWSQVEINEAEVDGILANVKRGKEPPSRVGSIQARNALHKKHTERLEQVLRALDNEAITVEQVDGLKEAIEDYCVCSQYC